MANRMTNLNLTSIVDDEAKSWERIQNLRASFSPNLFDYVHIARTEEAVFEGMDTVQEVLSAYEAQGLSLKNDPAHGIGHMSRDLVNALSVVPNLDADPRQLYVGFVGAVLHDTGLALIERYIEGKRAVRHAEVGALLFMDIVERARVNVGEEEMLAIAHSIAGHTHYLGPSDVMCSDGVERRVEPYQDLLDNGEPILGMWIPRWVDRLDCNGPTFAARHWLTLAEDHEDFSTDGFYTVKFAQSMIPSLRDPGRIKSEGGRTMLEHFKMFADSQSSASPYGKHDFGAMVDVRDKHTEMTRAIIGATQSHVKLTEAEVRLIGEAWDLFLTSNVEPTRESADDSDKLLEAFYRLPDDHVNAWSLGFLEIMKQYSLWAEMKIEALDKLGTDPVSLPSVTDDLFKMINPSPEWINIVDRLTEN